jgi:hypothetical protein
MKILGLDIDYQKNFTAYNFINYLNNKTNIEETLKQHFNYQKFKNFIDNLSEDEAKAINKSGYYNRLIIDYDYNNSASVEENLKFIKDIGLFDVKLPRFMFKEGFTDNNTDKLIKFFENKIENKIKSSNTLGEVFDNLGHQLEINDVGILSYEDSNFVVKLLGCKIGNNNFIKFQNVFNKEILHKKLSYIDDKWTLKSFIRISEDFNRDLTLALLRK